MDTNELASGWEPVMQTGRYESRIMRRELVAVRWPGCKTIADKTSALRTRTARGAVLRISLKVSLFLWETNKKVSKWAPSVGLLGKPLLGIALGILPEPCVCSANEHIPLKGTLMITECIRFSYICFWATRDDLKNSQRITINQKKTEMSPQHWPSHSPVWKRPAIASETHIVTIAESKSAIWRANSLKSEKRSSQWSHRIRALTKSPEVQITLENGRDSSDVLFIWRLHW